VSAETVTAWAGHSMGVEERHHRKVYEPADMILIERVLPR